MEKHKAQIPIVIIVILTLGGVIVTACASGVLANSQSPLDSQVNTAVAATLVQYIIETKVAAQAAELKSEEVALAQPTSTPVPTTAPLPTSTPLPTEAPAQASNPPQPPPTQVPAETVFPKISADNNTNCRLGPGTRYNIIGYFFAGSVSYVHGKDQTKNWWYIEHPSKPGEFCWVWDGSTTVDGDTSKLALIDAPILPATKTNYVYDEMYGYDPYYGFTYPNGYFPFDYYPYTPNLNKCWWNTNCGKSSQCCGSVQICFPINWAGCGGFVTCTCNLTVKNPCKKSACPPVTQVNFVNYCKKYPKCCK